MCYQNGVVVTIDTNVLFQAFYSRRGASHQIVRFMRDGTVVAAISVPVFQEYRDVLSRKENMTQSRLNGEQVETIMQFLATVGRPTNVAYTWRPNLRDEGDNMFIELARASGSEYLIAGNTRDFLLDADLKNEDIRVVTPAAFMNHWRSRNE